MRRYYSLARARLGNRRRRTLLIIIIEEQVRIYLDMYIISL